MLSFVVVNAQQKNDVYQDTVVIDTAYTTADIEVAPTDTIYVDTTLYYNRLTISPDSIENWKNLNEFAYVKHLDSLLKAKQAADTMKEKEIASSGPGWFENLLSSGGFQLMLWILAVLFILFILYKLFLTEGAFRKNSKNLNSLEPQAEEEIINEQSDFEQLIKQAFQKDNYRLAVRYHYLKTIHKLADKNLISLAADKTNYQYVREISNPNYQNDFAALTLKYEYVWYGEFAIDESIYKRMEPDFLQFNNKL